MEQFPSNSNKSKETPRAEKVKRVEKVVEGGVTRRKKSIGQRLVENFIGDSLDNVVRNVVSDVVVPAAKDMVLDGVERLLTGDNLRGRRRSNRSGGNGHFSYNTVFSVAQNRFAKDEGPSNNMSRRARQEHVFDNIVLKKRHEAIAVLQEMEMIVLDHGEVTVGDLYRLVDEPATFADEKWGWSCLDGSDGSRPADVQQIRHGFLLRLPRPEPLN